MFGISGTELVIILFFGFLIFGPDKLPQMGRTVGRAIRQFKNASEAANKKFKEEVADPFQEAMAPHKEKVEESIKPFQDDINAINDTINETKSMFTDPFKDILSPSKPAPKKPAGVAIAGGTAPEAARHPERGDEVPESRDLLRDSSTPGSDEPSARNDVASDPFAGVLDDAPNVIPSEAEGSRPSTKKSMAASLYDLDDDDVKGGE